VLDICVRQSRNALGDTPDTVSLVCAKSRDALLLERHRIYVAKCIKLDRVHIVAGYRAEERIERERA